MRNVTNLLEDFASVVRDGRVTANCDLREESWKEEQVAREEHLERLKQEVLQMPPRPLAVMKHLQKAGSPEK